MPSGTRYWTVLDDKLEVMTTADRFLRHVRFGQDRAESTTKAYAGSVALYLRWCLRTGRDWRVAVAEMGLFMVWLKYVPAGAEDQHLVRGPGTQPVRGERRINKVLTAVRGFLAFAVARDEAPSWILGQIYDLADSRDLPLEAQAEDARLAYRLRAQHRLHEPETVVDRAADVEIVAMFRACRSARDRLIVLLMARAGLRRGELTGLRRSDVHLLVDNASLGCLIEGAHVHVHRRANSNSAWAKSRRSRVVPLDFVSVQALDQYVAERHQIQAAICRSDSGRGRRSTSAIGSGRRTVPGNGCCSRSRPQLTRPGRSTGTSRWTPPSCAPTSTPPAPAPTRRRPSPAQKGTRWWNTRTRVRGRASSAS
jgi:integrase